MYQKGLTLLQERKIKIFENEDLEEMMACGFNFPVSVKV
jgi:hypothetical protein